MVGLISNLMNVLLKVRHVNNFTLPADVDGFETRSVCRVLYTPMPSIAHINILGTSMLSLGAL